MDYGAISAVMQRISDIEDKIGVKHKVAAPGFQEMLKGEFGKTKPKAGKKNSALKTNQPEEFVNPANAHRVIEEAAKRHGVDPKLVSAVAQTESAMQQEAVSDAGAVGIMQLMPETASELGINPYNAKENVEGGAKYLRKMLDVFGGDVTKAVAAYNAGPKAVETYGGIPPYKETQEYVAKVLDLYQ